jgi:small subunit ribosomal protein S17
MARQITGTVVSDKANKTIVITVRERRTHPLYKKQYTVSTKFMAHDEKNDAKSGDLVTIVETRPLSARKHFKLDKILERGGARFEEADAVADIPQEEPNEPAPAPKAKKAKPETTKEEKK